MRRWSEENLRCSFCHKNQSAVERLIASPGDAGRAYICNECIVICQSILDEERQKQEATATAPPRLPKPAEIKEFLDQYVIGQDKTKKRLAVAVYNHY